MDSIIKCYRDFDLHIHIRDDGSVDSTCEIIKEYISKNDSIFLYEGDNVGVIASFCGWLRMLVIMTITLFAIRMMYGNLLN